MEEGPFLPALYQKRKETGRPEDKGSDTANLREEKARGQGSGLD